MSVTASIPGFYAKDERVWGSTEWGFRYQVPMFEAVGIDATSHADGICLNSTVMLDGECLVDEGTVVHKGLKELARQMGK